ncbi:alpha-L-rhamnosidase C-terminal domain-containing protein [Demequina sp.]|uniref:alpha-L-rhamnosidase C-terminal domain-containing protein n=1 Tax=Demequina sp. TaxID=2050685 RepID=UPI003A89FEF2
MDIETPRGQVAVAWRKDQARWWLDVSVPHGSTATCRVRAHVRHLSAGEHSEAFEL